MVTAALDEARRRRDRWVGTEHPLLGMLQDPGLGRGPALGTELGADRSTVRGRPGTG